MSRKPRDRELKADDRQTLEAHNDDLRLLIEWSSPWQEFVTAIGPALSKSPRHLAGEAKTELFPYRGMLLSWLVEIIAILAVIVLPARLASLRPYQPPTMPKYDVIYFSGDELPQTEDRGGARAGRSGRAGGHEAHHRTQVIRVARGDLLREKIVDAPKLNLPMSSSAVANLLAYKPIPGPAPAEGLRPSLQAPRLAETAVAPAPAVAPEKLRRAPALSATVVPPPPSTPQRNITSARIPGSQAVSVVPPPVSAPEQITNLNPRLTLPAPSVVAPPPTQIARDLKASGPGFGAGELQKQIVPPPVQAGSASSERRSFGGFGSASVVPPPVQVGGAPNGRGTAASLGSPNVVPPPVQVGGGSLGKQTTVAGLGGGSAVVPPPPSVSGAGSAGGMGHGNRGTGLGGPLDAGSVTAPPSNTGGNTSGNGIVLSSQPGAQVGVPGGAGAGSLALSPAGGNKLGVGEGQGGEGIARGAGPGSGFSGEGSGGAKSGAGLGADASAHGGISPYPGSGGAGTGGVGKPPLPGVSVHGGNNIITLPSFGADGGGSATAPGRTSAMKGQEGPDITVVGTSRSGGAFNFYGTLKGDKVYTIYINTALGPAVLEYADPTSVTHPYGEDLTAPHPMRTDLPANLKRSRLIIACVLDRSGLLRNPRVLAPGAHELTIKVLAALPAWKFRPAFRGEQPVEVNAILGFDIDTR
ncbi:MAG: hypothetical protein WBQ09_00620 [Terriglobales bacterium]